MTLKSVTKALREATGDSQVELCRSRDGSYFYFTGGVADHFTQQGVYVNRLRSLTVDEWVRELKSRIEA